MQRGLRAVAEKFRDQAAEGPTWVAGFLGEGDPEHATRVRQDAFMTVREVCRLLQVDRM